MELLFTKEIGFSSNHLREQTSLRVEMMLYLMKARKALISLMAISVLLLVHLMASFKEIINSMVKNAFVQLLQSLLAFEVDGKYGLHLETWTLCIT